MVGVQLNTEVAYGQATSNLEGYKFNNSCVILQTLNQSFTLAKDWSATWNSFIVKMEITETLQTILRYVISMRKIFLTKNKNESYVLRKANGYKVRNKIM
jgi:hypothetical protein